VRPATWTSAGKGSPAGPPHQRWGRDRDAREQGDRPLHELGPKNAMESIPRSWIPDGLVGRATRPPRNGSDRGVRRIGGGAPRLPRLIENEELASPLGVESEVDRLPHGDTTRRRASAPGALVELAAGPRAKALGRRPGASRPSLDRHGCHLHADSSAARRGRWLANRSVATARGAGDYDGGSGLARLLSALSGDGKLESGAG